MQETLDYFFGASLADKGLISLVIISMSVSVVLSLRLVKSTLLSWFLIILVFVGSYFPIGTTPLIHILIYIVPAILLGLVINGLLSGEEEEKKSTNPFIVSYQTDKGTQYIDIVRGLGIFGAAGSGKTASGFLPIIKHAAGQGLCGMVYDYKDFELTELVQGYYQKSKVPVYIVSPHRPELSHRVNPIHPDYLTSYNDAHAFSSALMDNLLKGDGENFFSQAAKGAMAGVIWKLRNAFVDSNTPDKCSLPYATAVFLKKSPEALVEFLLSDDEASVLAKAFLDSAGSDRQMAGVMGSISNAVVQLASPEVFHVFSGNDIPLDLNRPGSEGLLCVVGHPKYEKVLSPFIATLVRCVLLRMSERDRLPSMLLLDEFPTLNLADVSRIPATMRSYGIATVLGVQDKVQMAETYKETTMKALIANLSSRILGKVNDPDTARFYERYFELVDEEHRSTTRREGILSTGGNASVTISSRERAKHRAQEFHKLRPGELFFLDEKGVSKKVRVVLEKKEKVPKLEYQYESTGQEKTSVDTLQLKERFNRILEEASNF